MRIFNKSLAVAACVAAVTFGAVAPPAQALILWEHENYKGYLGPTVVRLGMLVIRQTTKLHRLLKVKMNWEVCITKTTDILVDVSLRALI